MRLEEGGVTEAEKEMDISYEACVELHEKARQVLMTLLIDKPRIEYRNGRSDPITERAFTCDVDVFQQFAATANAEYDTGDIENSKLLIKVDMLAERLAPSGITTIDAGEAFAIEQLSAKLIHQAQYSDMAGALGQYQMHHDKI